MIKDYEENIIDVPLEFRDDYKPIPTPRKKKSKPNIIIVDDTSDEETEKPKPMPRTIIKYTKNALKNHKKSFKVNIKNNKDPLAQMQNTRITINQKLKTILKETNGFKLNETLTITFTKLSNHEVLYKTGYFNCKAKTIINENEIQFELETSLQEILNKIAVWTSEGSGWVIKSIYNHFINIVNYKPLKRFIL